MTKISFSIDDNRMTAKKKLLDELKSSITFCAEKIFKFKNSTIHIEFDNLNPKNEEFYDEGGFVIPNVLVIDKKFLNEKSKKKLFDCIFHEVKHYYQYRKNIKNVRKSWRSEKMSAAKTDRQYAKYRNHWSEKDARKFGHKMAKFFMSSKWNKIKRLTFVLILLILFNENQFFRL
jgi:hypothetical protein